MEDDKNNPKKLKVLCVCTMGLNRSKYLAEYLEKRGYDTRYGGVGPCKIDPEPANPAKKEDVEWADIIITARDKNKQNLKKNFGIKDKKIIVLEVSDSRYKAYLKNPDWKEISQEDYNKIWTYPQLRKKINKYLPLNKKMDN